MATIPDVPEGMAGAEAQGWRGFHAGTGLDTNGAPPRAWAHANATRYLRGWWQAHAYHYGQGAAAFTRFDGDARALAFFGAEAVNQPENPWPQFSAMWEAWAAGFEAIAGQTR